MSDDTHTHRDSVPNRVIKFCTRIKCHSFKVKTIKLQRADIGTFLRVELFREPGKSLGISIVGGRGMGSRLSNGEVMRGIFIKHILEDSPAGQNGTLKTGDRIVEAKELLISQSDQMFFLSHSEKLLTYSK